MFKTIVGLVSKKAFATSGGKGATMYIRADTSAVNANLASYSGQRMRVPNPNFNGRSNATGTRNTGGNSRSNAQGTR